MNGIAWSQIAYAAERRLVAMTAELAGYLVLGIVDALSGRAGQASSDTIRLDEEGRVLVARVIACSTEHSNTCLGRLLKTMLDVSSSSCPALARLATLSGRDCGFVDFGEELRKALIPVNRAAARRALARLYRELARLEEVTPRDGKCEEVPMREHAALDATIGPDPSHASLTERATARESVVAQVLQRETESFLSESAVAAPEPLPTIAAPEPTLAIRVTPAIRETTLVMAPVAVVSRVERTEPLALAGALRQPELPSDRLPIQDSSVVAEPTKALPLVKRRRAIPLPVEVESGDALMIWDQTSIEAVAEVTDDEIRYEELPGECPCVPGECSDESSDSPMPQTEAVLAEACHIDEVPIGARADVESIDANDEAVLSSLGGCSRQLESPTYYCSGDVARATSYSTVEVLAGQFVNEPLWSNEELSQSLRVLAGMEPLSTALSCTPPPMVENVGSPRQEQLEPTRRLRPLRAATTAGVVLAGMVYGTQLLGDATTALASPLPGDALNQICRATVMVAGVEPEQRIEVRQTGDNQFRQPSRIVGNTAIFSGLQCARDAELLVVSSASDGLRRIPISGVRLQPRGTHPWAVTELKLDGSP